MSAFLGPIHYLMYTRILIQENLTAQMLQYGETQGWIEGMSKELIKRYGEPDTAPLEEIIDQSNIHGWLSGRIEKAENRFKDVVLGILSVNEDYMEELKKFTFEYGKMQDKETAKTIEEQYKFLDRVLLDGMPCDGGRTLLPAESSGEIVWEYVLAEHPLCEKFGRFGNPFGELRNAMIKGMLQGSGFVLDDLGDGGYRLREGEAHESN